MKPRYPKIGFDRLKILFGDPYVIDLENVSGSITVKSPSIGDIVEIGEFRFYSTLNVLIGNTTQNRLMLWRLGKDWCELSDFELFVMTYTQMDADVVNLLFENIDFSSFEPCDHMRPDGTSELVLYSQSTDTEINEDVYQHFHQYLQEVFNMKPEEEITKDKHLKEWWIRKDTVAEEQKAKKEDVPTSSFRALISTYVNHPATKHSLQELREVGVAEFFDSLARIKHYESATAMLKGIYSGFVDTKSINPSECDISKDI